MKVLRVQYPEVTYRIGDILPPSYTPSATVTHKVTSCDSSRAKSERRSGRGMYANEERTLGKMKEKKERRKRENKE